MIAKEQQQPCQLFRMAFSDKPCAQLFFASQKSLFVSKEILMEVGSSLRNLAQLER